MSDARRRYSIDEIDAMRGYLRSLEEHISWHYNGNSFSGCGRSYTGADPLPAIIEDRLRTHMTNGTDPEELRQKVIAKNTEENEWMALEKARWHVANAKAAAESP